MGNESNVVGFEGIGFINQSLGYNFFTLTGQIIMVPHWRRPFLGNKNSRILRFEYAMLPNGRIRSALSI